MFLCLLMSFCFQAGCGSLFLSLTRFWCLLLVFRQGMVVCSCFGTGGSTMFLSSAKIVASCFSFDENVVLCSCLWIRLWRHVACFLADYSTLFFGWSCGAVFLQTKFWLQCFCLWAKFWCCVLVFWSSLWCHVLVFVRDYGAMFLSLGNLISILYPCMYFFFLFVDLSHSLFNFIQTCKTNIHFWLRRNGKR